MIGSAIISVKIFKNYKNYKIKQYIGYGYIIMKAYKCDSILGVRRLNIEWWLFSYQNQDSAADKA